MGGILRELGCVAETIGGPDFNRLTLIRGAARFTLFLAKRWENIEL
jgi:hypothetical protein